MTEICTTAYAALKVVCQANLCNITNKVDTSRSKIDRYPLILRDASFGKTIVITDKNYHELIIQLQGTDYLCIHY